MRKPCTGVHETQWFLARWVLLWFLCDGVFTCRMEFIENRLSKIIDQVCILSRHKFALFKTTDFQVFWYILLYSAYSDISSILIAVFFWVFFQFQNKHSGRTDCRVSFFGIAGFLESFYWKKKHIWEIFTLSFFCSQTFNFVLFFKFFSIITARECVCFRPFIDEILLAKLFETACNKPSVWFFRIFWLTLWLASHATENLDIFISL